MTVPTEDVKKRKLMKMDRYFNNSGEKPLDSIVSDGGMASIFRTIAVVGDSLSSGEFESIDEKGNKGYHDFFEYSWGQFLARMCGSTCYNFSRGGMTALEYCEYFAEQNRFWNNNNAADAYIIALGCNDLYGRNQTVGEASDYEENGEVKDTFAYYMGQIISRYQNIQPRAKFFLLTMPNEKRDDDKAVSQNKLMYALAERFDNTYVIDLYRYAPVYDEEFKKKFYLLGHLNPMGYRLTAEMVASYIDYIIRHNPEDFKEVGYIGTNYHG